MGEGQAGGEGGASGMGRAVARCQGKEKSTGGRERRVTQGMDEGDIITRW